MKPIPKHSVRLVAACVAFTAVFPAHAAPLALRQLPPQAVVPPSPNILVTLDDSGSMASTVAFDVRQNYSVPLGPTGVPIATQTTPPMAYQDGYLLVSPLPAPIDVSSVPRYPTLGSAEAKQKFVNWYGFYRTRNMAMKAAVMSAFNPTVVPDDQFRIAWQGLTETCHTGFPASSLKCPSNNAMWTLSDSVAGRTHRTNFFNWVRSVPPGSGTPLRDAAHRAGQYFLTTGVNSPWAHQPGVSETPARSCRRSYHILFTDGEYNGGSDRGNNDNEEVTLPDGVIYKPIPPYRGPAVGGSNTLADITFRYWATDLQKGAGYENTLRPIIRQSGSETYGAASVEEYWNPKNNPATWQHLTTYTVGFGPVAAITDPLWVGPTTAGEGFAKIVDGSSNWLSVNAPTEFPGRRANLWQAAVNARGEFFPATSQDALNLAFKSILAGVIADGMTSGGGVSSLSAVASGDFTVVRAGFTDTPTWRAQIKGFGITPSGRVDLTEKWDGQTVVGAQPADSRVVLTSSAPRSGVAFRWDRLSDYQKTALNLSYTGFADGLGTDRVDYLRGSNAKEASAPGGVLRKREGAVIGTVVNSEPRIVQAPRSGYISPSYQAYRAANRSRTPITYVGANDGMMHGIRASDGMAVLSYVPRAVYAKLPFYTDPAYTHHMYVDGPLISSDFQDATDDNKWKTILVGGLGAGGKGLFALDVTKPSDFEEGKASSLVKFDYTAPAGAFPSSFTSEVASAPMLGELQTDMGHVFGDPSRDAFIGRNLQITRMQNGKWAVISGNGVNSVNEKAVLYIIYLDGSGFVKIPASLSSSESANGMAIPFPADINGDGLTDSVYAGDLLGRMWKFDLRSDNPTEWVKPENTKLMIETGRPITTAPTLLIHPQGGVLVAFGTGRQLVESDATSTEKESIYGIWDKPSGAWPVTDTDLAIRQLAVKEVVTDDDGPRKGAEARVLDGGKAAAVDYGKKRGWKIELLKTGEKVVFNPIGDGTRVFFSTSTASTDICKAADGGSFLAFDGITGTEPSSPVLDINGDGKFGKSDTTSGKSTMGRAAPIGRLIGIVEPPPLPAGAAPESAPCSDPANLAFGALGEMCIAKNIGVGRKLWRDLRP